MTLLHDDSASETASTNTSWDVLRAGTTSEVYRRAAQLGIVAGLRSMMPFALFAWADTTNSSSNLKNVTGILAIGEVIADKLPVTPSRLSSGMLIGRIAAGAVAGAWLCRCAHISPLQGAVRGAIGAGIGSLAGSFYRKLTSQSANVPDAVWALIEDGIALSIGTNAIGALSIPEHR